jgi:AraC family L-rhamnose operon transcriptional activator RhaR
MANVDAIRGALFSHGAPVDILRIRRHRERALHRHGWSELVVVLGGRGVHYTTSETWAIGAGDAFVVSGDGAHGYRDVRDLHLVNVMWYPDRVGLPEGELRELPGYHLLFGVEPALRRAHGFRARLRLGARDLAAVSAVLDELEAELSRCERGFRAMAAAQLVRLVCRIARCDSVSRTDEAAAARRLADVIAFIEANHAHRLTLRGLASRARMPVNTLLRAFRRATGSTPIDYAIHRRIAAARELLRSGGRSVTEIALAVGFSDSNYFARRFRSATGITPSAYRVLTSSDPVTRARGP